MFLNTGLVFASLDKANTSTCLTTSIDPKQLQSTTSAATKEKAKRNSASNHDNCSFQIRLGVQKDRYCRLVSITDEHNHGKATAFTPFARHYRLNPEQTESYWPWVQESDHCGHYATKFPWLRR
ncbi:hypothetical protein [Absidia glauca]|uniref:Uncharacterized protein n=1 Tax=Absidia glauca TaxID=4829 RepID=A0A168Q8T3_ABSGL|nr:hypothetical protein [Absidia glauca]